MSANMQGKAQNASSFDSVHPQFTKFYQEKQSLCSLLDVDSDTDDKTSANKPSGFISNNSSNQTNHPIVSSQKEENEENTGLPNTPENILAQDSCQNAIRAESKDNISFKLIAALFNKTYKMIFRQKISFEDVSQSLKPKISNKDYILYLLSKVQLKGGQKLIELKDKIERQIPSFLESKKQKHSNSPAFYNQIEKDAKKAFKALSDLTNGEKIEDIMKNVYSYDKMRQRSKFQVAYKKLIEFRKTVGLSY